MDKLKYLIEYLLDESNTPKAYNKNFLMYRRLVNIREPRPISDEYLKVENQYLQEILKEKEVIDVKDIATIKEDGKSMLNNPDKICIYKGDITKIKIDAIVNAANSQGLGCFAPVHNCIDNQIHTYAGVSLRLECKECMKTFDYKLSVSKCFITDGYNLPARKIIHSVGPIVNVVLTDKLRRELSNTYINALECAIENNVRTIAFPCISTGVFRFPKDEASKIAIKAVDELLINNREKIDKVVFITYEDKDYNYYKNNINKLYKIY